MSAIVAEKGDGMTESIPAATERLYLTLDGNFTYRAQGKLIFVGGMEEGEGQEGGDKKKVDVVFDRSPFHPQGGGQPSDVGKVVCAGTGIELKVVKVSFSFETNVVTHHCESGAGVTMSELAVGETWGLFVDEEKRNTFSKFHSAGHMVDRAMELCGYNMPATKGYHFLDSPYVEYKGKVEAPKREELIVQLNEKFKELIEEGRLRDRVEGQRRRAQVYWASYLPYCRHRYSHDNLLTHERGSRGGAQQSSS